MVFGVAVPFSLPGLALVYPPWGALEQVNHVEVVRRIDSSGPQRITLGAMRPSRPRMLPENLKSPIGDQ